MFCSDCIGRAFYYLLFMSAVMNANTFSFVLIFDMFVSFGAEFSEEVDANFLCNLLRGGKLLVCSRSSENVSSL